MQRVLGDGAHREPSRVGAEGGLQKGDDLVRKRLVVAADVSRVDAARLAARLVEGEPIAQGGRFHVVAIDYGVKRNILRLLTQAGCKVTVVPATATADEIFALKPDGVFLSNGPGDPAATGLYATPVIRAISRTASPPSRYIRITSRTARIFALLVGITSSKLLVSREDRLKRSGSTPPQRVGGN